MPVLGSEFYRPVDGGAVSLTWLQIKNNILKEFLDHANPENGVSFMSLALYVWYLWLTSNRMAAMLDFANMAGPSGARLGALQKCKLYGIFDLWAKFGAFGRIWTKQSVYCPNTHISIVEKTITIAHRKRTRTIVNRWIRVHIYFLEYNRQNCLRVFVTCLLDRLNNTTAAEQTKRKLLNFD